MRDDLDFLAAQLIPEESKYPFPPFYKTVWALILSNLYNLRPDELFRFALGLPRGHVKTTFLKLLMCYLIIHKYEIDFLLVVCATEPLAENFLTDVNNMMKSPIIADIYGSWDNALIRDTKKVVTADWLGRKIILAAIGSGTSLRGLNIRHKRPQLIVCDDAQTAENDKSATERAHLLRWLVGTLFKARAKVEKSAIIYVGNMYSTDCILYKFSKMPNWVSLITGAILADKTALWPEINTVEELLEEYRHDAALGLGSVWFAEVQNDPIGATIGLLDQGEEIAPFQERDQGYWDIYPTRFITVDPAGMKATSDDNVVATHCLMEGNRIGTLALANGKWSPKKVITEIITQALECRVGTIFIESNAYQGTLDFWLNQALEELNVFIEVVPIPTGTASKYRRIKAFVKLWAAGEWEFADAEIQHAVEYQLYSYKTDRTDNVDDILDVQAQAVLAVNKHSLKIINNTKDEAEDDPANTPHTTVTPTIIDQLRGANHGRP